jgi:hypothetical protein
VTAYSQKVQLTLSEEKKKKGDEVAESEDDAAVVRTSCHKTE